MPEQERTGVLLYRGSGGAPSIRSVTPSHFDHFRSGPALFRLSRLRPA